MPRNQEVIRQWKLLHALEAARHGISLDELARDLEVTTRTIRRDLAALQEAGFPLYDVRDELDRVRWCLEGQAFKSLDTGFTLAELCALYLSRNLLEAVGGSPFQRDLGHAFSRLEAALSPRMRQFLDRLPGVVGAKPGPRVHAGVADQGIVDKLLEATLHLRTATMRYDSASSGREKRYLVHPYRLAFAHGGLYLIAFVPEYDAIRTFAMDRIRAVSLEKETFTPRRELPEDLFENSLGVNTGPTAQAEVRFAAQVAPFVRARLWHASQQLTDHPDGSLTLTLEVCHDWALRSWILGWGPFARVLSPASLASDVAAELRRAAAQYDS